MMDQDQDDDKKPNLGAAQPIMDSVNEGINKVKKWFTPSKPATPPAPAPDTSWHDQQVREANDSFRKAAATPATPPAPAKPQRAGKRMMKRSQQ